MKHRKPHLPTERKLRKVRRAKLYGPPEGRKEWDDDIDIDDSIVGGGYPLRDHGE